MNVVKFGGSSLASAPQLQKVLQIVKEEPRRTFVVVSAPGKRTPQDIKVTDLLIQYYQRYLNNEEIESTISAIIRRYEDLFDELHLDKAVLADIAISIRQLATLPKENNAFLFDYFLASGEDNNAKVVASFFNQNGLDARYISPKELGLLVTPEPGNARILPKALEKISAYRETQ